MKTIRLLIILVMLVPTIRLSAQHYTGMTGLINTPSADMNRAGDVMIGSYFLNKHFLPDPVGDKSGFILDGKKYDTVDFFASITPFSWVELGYTFTLFKAHKRDSEETGYTQKDRYMSVKFNPLKEGKYYPAIAIGANDFLGSPTKIHNNGANDSGYFNNYYIVATKHFAPYGNDISVNAAYRYCSNEHTKKWQGVTAGVTWRPQWIPDLRAIAEYTGHEINIGADILLCKHLFMQVCLQDGRYLSGGACVKMNLF